MGFYTNVLFS